MIYRKGSKGIPVVGIQTALNKVLGLSLVTDGDFGGGTEDSVRAFQKKFGLEADGIVGDATMTELYVAMSGKYEPQSSDLPDYNGAEVILPHYTWIDIGRKMIGIKEIKGSNHHPEILKMWQDIKRGGIKDDETPWCSAFVGSCFERAGIVSSRHENSQSWNTWGEKLTAPIYGCVVTFTRDGGGHVGICMGRTAKGNLLILGGNQSDGVNIKEFTKDRVKEYRKPVGVEMANILPIGDAMELSTKED